MVERPKANNIKLYESERLHGGSYGEIGGAKNDRPLFAAKVILPPLFDRTTAFLSKNCKECDLILQLRHHNVAQYLAICYSPYTRLPVLLTGLCDESFTAFLERSPGPLPYHIRVNICHDIVLALVYLHNKSPIDRDLRGKNLMIMARTRAKIADFRMSELALTLVQCNKQPKVEETSIQKAFFEAECQAGTRAKITDIGMSELALTLDQCYKLPKVEETSIQKAFFEAECQAGTRAKITDIGMSELALTLDQCYKLPKVEETSIRKAFFEAEYHLPQLRFILAIPLKELPLLCLSNKERHLSAAEVSKRLYNLKQSSKYAESMHEPQSDSEIHTITTIIGGKGRKEAHELPNAISMQYQKRHPNVVVGRMEQKDKRLQVGEELVSEFQDSLQQKGKTGLEQTISDNERRLKQLEQGDTTSRNQQQQHPVTVSKATAVATKKNISKMRWRVGKNAPQPMHRGVAVVHRNTAYFRPCGSKMIYSYQNTLGREKWSWLPDNPNRNCGLAVIDGVLTSVGGWNTDGPTNTLLSLTGEGRNKQWSEIFPPMPTQRSHIACASIGQALIVAGGREASDITDSVEVMNASTKVWTAACSLPQKCTSLSASICGHTLFLGGGDMGLLNVSKTVLTCDITELLYYTEHKEQEMSNVWKEISSLPVTQSTLVSLGGDMLAIGGRDDCDKPTSNVYRYDSHTDSWNVASEMNNSQTSCLVVALPEGHLTVVGEFAVNTTARDLLDDQPKTDRKQGMKTPFSSKYIKRTINEEKSYVERSERDHALRHYGRLCNPATQPAITTFVQHKTDPRALLYRLKHLELRYLNPGTYTLNPQFFDTSMRLSSKSVISDMMWRFGKDPPEPMQRGAAVVHRHTAYFIPAISQQVYSYQNIQGKEKWSQLQANPNRNCGLAVVDGVLTSVGGWNTDGPTNTLLSLIGEDEKQWCEIFPPMPTIRESAICITTEQALVVAGGLVAGDNTNNVEAFHTGKKLWTTVCPLPHKFSSLSATICGNMLYVAGGLTEYLTPSKSVFTCSLSDLLCSLPSSHNVWKKINSLPVTRSTVVSFGGDLLAIGGEDDFDEPTSNFYIYDSHTDSWIVAGQMKNSQTSCLVVALPEGHLTVVGEFAVNTTAYVDSLDDQPSIDWEEETSTRYLSMLVRSERDLYNSLLFDPESELVKTSFVQHKSNSQKYSKRYAEFRNSDAEKDTLDTYSGPSPIFYTSMRHNTKSERYMRWRRGGNPPEPMQRGAAAVHRHTAYFMPAFSHQVYSYQNIQGKEKWSQLQANPNVNCCLAIIDGFLTSVGGWNTDGPTNALFSLRKDGDRKKWLGIFPPMPTPRESAVCVITEQALVVAGGWVAGDITDNVEAFGTGTKLWITVCPLPHKFSSLSATICGNMLYVAGGFTEYLTPSKSVFTCSLSDLLRSLPSSHNVWKEIKSLPVTRSTVVSFGGELLAIGGENDLDKPTPDVYRYDSHTDSWNVASEMKNSQTSCLVVTLPDGHLTVMGEFAVNTTAYVDSKLCRTTSLSGKEKIERSPMLSSTDLAIQPLSHHRLQQSEERRMLWREEKNAPEAMWRGAAVVHGDTAYFSPGYSCKVYSYQENHWKEQWSRLPDNPNINCGLAIIDGLLTSVGGWKSGRPTNSLLSLTGEGKRKEWSEVYPPMPTGRTHVTCFTIDNFLIVAGGLGVYYDSIIVMNVKNMQWATVSYLPQKTLLLTATVCWGKLYLAGGSLSYSRSVFTCPVSDLVRSFITRSESAFGATLPSHNIWKEISSLPVVGSTLVSCGNEVLAIGGRDGSGYNTSNVYKYDSLSDTWTITSRMNNQRSECLAVTLPHHRLVVVGGYTKRNRLTTDSVEISGTRTTFKNVCIHALGSEMHIQRKHKGLKKLRRSKSLDLTSTTLVKQLFTASRALSTTSLSSAEVTVQNLSSLTPTSQLNNPPFSKCFSSTSKNKDGNEGEVRKLRWWEGENVQKEIRRGAAVVHENRAYFRPAYSHKVYSYQCIDGNEKWSRLPDNCNQNCGLAVINGLLTSVGGWNNGLTNTLLSLRGVGESQEWFKTFPSMPTPRSHVACITIEEALVVAGGLGTNYEFLDTVIIMNTNPINNMQWTTATSLPRRGVFHLTECTGTLYLIGGSLTDSKSVFTCFVLDLFMLSLTRSESAFGAPLPSCNIWKEISSLPVIGSTLVSCGNDLLAIGGRDESGFNTSNVYMYDYLSDTWTITSQMKNQRSECFAVTLPHHRLVVLGGYTKKDVDLVEIMSLGHHRPFKIVPSEADVFYNQREQTAVASEFCTLPQHFTLISTLSHCTSEGRMFTDEANDFSLEIPEGAIPEGVRLTVDVAVSLFSPFQFPEGLRPVSPVFWVCVHEQRNFQFSKPVLVTIPHFLNIEDDDDITSLGLTFLKADHNKNSEGLYEFKQTPGEMDLKTTKRLGVIKMSHFCSLCLASKDIPKCLEKAWFCITAVLPIFSVPVGKRAQAHFFITFLNLKTCLYKVKDIIESMDLEGYCTKQRKFQFKASTTAAIEIVISKPCCGMIGLDGSKKIFRSEVDFFVKRRLSQGELECLKSDDFYPPRFDVFFASFQENATLSDGKIAFRGATSDIEFNIHLDVPHPRTRPVAIHAPTTETRDIGSQTEELPVGNSVASQLASGSNVHECSDAPPNLFPASISHKTGRLDINKDIPITKRCLQHLNKEELKQLFQELGLYHATVMDNFSDSSQGGYAEGLIRSWILGRDGVLTSEVYRGGATRENLTKALRTHNHHGIADSIIPL